MQYRMALVALATVGALFLLLAASATASTSSERGSAQVATSHAASNSSSNITLYRPFPEGLPANNAQAAFEAVMGRASWDSSYANTLAQQTGAAQFNPADYKPHGYASRAPAGTTNSGLTGQGQVVPVADHNGSQYVRVFIIMNLATGKTVSLMVRCGNPRLHPFVRVIPWRPFHLGTIIRINRTVSKPVTITCKGTGQTVSGTLYASLKGYFKARTWGRVRGDLKLHLKAQYKLQLRTWVSLHCGPPPVSYSASWETINDIPRGTCRPEELNVDSTKAGSEKIYANIGLVSLVDCYQPPSEQHQYVTPPVAVGNNQSIWVYVYEPSDSSATSDTLFAVPQIDGVDAGLNTATSPFNITDPQGP